MYLLKIYGIIALSLPTDVAAAATAAVVRFDSVYYKI